MSEPVKQSDEEMSTDYCTFYNRHHMNHIFRNGVSFCIFFFFFDILFYGDS